MRKRLWLIAGVFVALGVPGVLLSYLYLSPDAVPTSYQGTEFLFRIHLVDSSSTPEILVRNDGYDDSEKVNAIVQMHDQPEVVSKIDVFFRDNGLKNRQWKCGPAYFEKYSENSSNTTHQRNEFPLVPVSDLDQSEKEDLIDGLSPSLQNVTWDAALSLSQADVDAGVLSGAECSATGETAPMVGPGKRLFLGTRTTVALEGDRPFRVWGWSDIYLPGAWEPYPLGWLAGQKQDSLVPSTWIESSDQVTTQVPYVFSSGIFGIRDSDDERRRSVASWIGALLIGALLGWILSLLPRGKDRHGDSLDAKNSLEISALRSQVDILANNRTQDVRKRAHDLSLVGDKIAASQKSLSDQLYQVHADITSSESKDRRRRKRGALSRATLNRRRFTRRLTRRKKIN
jgi:hypothetical protein